MKAKLQKILTVALALSLIFALAACGSEKAEATPEPTEAPAGTEVEAVSSATPAVEIKDILKLVPGEPLEVLGQQLLYTVDSEGPDQPGDVVLSYGSASARLGGTEWGCDSFVVVFSNEEILVYTTFGFSSDWHQTLPVIIHNGAMTVFAPADGLVASAEDITATDRCILQSRANVFGTYGTKTSYILTESGLVAEGSYVRIINEKQVEDGSYFDGLENDSFARQVCDENGRRILTLKKDLTLHANTGELYTVSVGSRLWPVGFDADAQQFFVEYGEGLQGWFEYSASSKGWGSAIDGIDEEEWFEFLPYAG